MKDKLARTLIASSGLLLGPGTVHAGIINETVFGPFANTYGAITVMPFATTSILGSIESFAGSSPCGSGPSDCQRGPFDFIRLEGYAPGQAFVLDLGFTEPAGSGSAGGSGSGSGAAVGEVHFIDSGSFVFFTGDSGNPPCVVIGPGTASGSDPAGSAPVCLPFAPGDAFGLRDDSFHVTGFASALGVIDIQIGGLAADYQLTVTAPETSTTIDPVSNVPVPSSLALMAAAAAGAGFLRRRRKT